MKTKKFLPFFLALGFLFLGQFPAKAEETSQKKDSGSILIATVDFFDAKIVSQEKNVFKISFDLYNQQNVQPQIIYGVQLIKQNEEALSIIEINGKKSTVIKPGYQTVVDQKVFSDDQMSLNAGEKVHREIVYTAPDFLSGTYALFLEAKNSEGTMLALYSLDNVDLKSDRKYLSIDENSCQIFIGSDNEKAYKPQEGGINVNPGDTLKIKCNIENNFDVFQNVTPKATTYYRSAFGKKISEQKLEAINFSSNEKSIREFTITVPAQPQFYNEVFVLTDSQGKQISSKMVFDFNVLGGNGMIQNVLLDKDAYKAGENANVQIWYLVNTDTKVSMSAEGGEMNILIKDGKGNACSDQFSQKQTADYKSDYSISIIKDCQNPTAEVVIKNKDGKVLAQNSFAVETKNEKANQEQIQEQKQASKSSLGQKTIIAGIILILILIGLLAFLISKRKGLIVFLGLIFFGSLLFVNQVKATTVQFSINDNGNIIQIGTFTASLDNNEGNSLYSEGQTIKKDWSVTLGWPTTERHSIQWIDSFDYCTDYSDGSWHCGHSGGFINTWDAIDLAYGGSRYYGSPTPTDVAPTCLNSDGTSCGNAARAAWPIVSSSGFKKDPHIGGNFEVWDQIYYYPGAWAASGTGRRGPYYIGSLLQRFQVKNPICGCHSGTCNTAGSCPTVGSATTPPTPSCSFGTASGLSDTGTAWCWTCTGQDSGGSPQCCVQKAIVPVDGVCGTAAGGTFASSPTINLCSAGNPSGVWIDSLNRWSWSCYGINGGSSPICTANPPTCVPAACALANTICSGQKYYETNCNTYCGIGTMDCVPVLNFTANGATTTSIDYGAETTLSWEVANATSCTASSIPLASNWSGAKDATATAGVPHTQLTGPLTETIKYTLTCSNSTGNSVTRDVTVNIDSSCIPSYSSYTCTKIDTGLSCDSNNCNQTITTQTGICTGVDDNNNCPDPPALSQEDCIKNGYPCSNIIKTCNNDACSGGGDDWTWIEVKP